MSMVAGALEVLFFPCGRGTIGSCGGSLWFLDWFEALVPIIDQTFSRSFLVPSLERLLGVLWDLEVFRGSLGLLLELPTFGIWSWMGISLS